MCIKLEYKNDCIVKYITKDIDLLFLKTFLTNTWMKCCNL
jgi:hypothetical protein